jgi:hypothetical protein
MCRPLTEGSRLFGMLGSLPENSMAGGYVALSQTPIKLRAGVRPDQIALFDG